MCCHRRPLRLVRARWRDQCTLSKVRNGGESSEETAGVKQIVSLRGGDRRAHSVSFIERGGGGGKPGGEQGGGEGDYREKKGRGASATSALPQDEKETEVTRWRLSNVARWWRKLHPWVMMIIINLLIRNGNIRRCIWSGGEPRMEYLVRWFQDQ